MAALVGALRFSGIFVDEPSHKLVSMVTGVAAFPALMISLGLPHWRSIQRWATSLVMLFVLAAIGVLIVTMTGSRLYLDACALVSTFGIAYACWTQRFIPGVFSAALMLFGLGCFATKISPVRVLQPADLLHLALALGWLGLNRRQRP